MFKRNKIGEMKKTEVCRIREYLEELPKRVIWSAMQKEDGIDGILVTVGLCIIALLLCVVMKDGLTTFINTIVTELTNEAKAVLSGVTP